MLRNLSWRVKIPLAIITAIVFTELVVTTTLLSQASRDAQADLRSNAQGLSQLLSHSLREPLVRDDLWQSYEIIRTPPSSNLFPRLSKLLSSLTSTQRFLLAPTL